MSIRQKENHNFILYHRNRILELSVNQKKINKTIERHKYKLKGQQSNIEHQKMEIRKNKEGIDRSNLFITHVSINHTIRMNEIDDQVDKNVKQIKINVNKKNKERKKRIAGDKANDDRNHQKIKQLRNEEDSRLSKIWQSVKAFWNGVANETIDFVPLLTHIIFYGIVGLIAIWFTMTFFLVIFHCVKWLCCCTSNRFKEKRT